MAKRRQKTAAMAWIEASGLRTAVLAEELRCTVSQVSRFRYGDRPVGYKHAAAFCRLSGLERWQLNLKPGAVKAAIHVDRPNHLSPAKVLADRRRAARRALQAPKVKAPAPETPRTGPASGAPNLTAGRVQTAIAHGVNPGKEWRAFVEQLPRGEIRVDEAWAKWCVYAVIAETDGEALGAAIGSDPPQEGSQDASPAPAQRPAELYGHLKPVNRPNFRKQPPAGVLVLNMPKQVQDQPEAHGTVQAED